MAEKKVNVTSRLIICLQAYSHVCPYEFADLIVLMFGLEQKNGLLGYIYYFLDFSFIINL